MNSPNWPLAAQMNSEELAERFTYPKGSSCVGVYGKHGLVGSHTSIICSFPVQDLVLHC